MKFTIEICSSKNNQAVFAPVLQALRGRWNIANMRGRFPHESHAALPDVIPGIRIEVDVQARTLRYFDPLDTPECADTYKQYQVASDRYPTRIPKMKPWPEKRIEDAEDTDIKTWLYYMRRLLNSGSAIEIGATSVPTLKEIEALPGKTRTSLLNDQIRRPVYREDFDEYNQPLPIGATASSRQSFAGASA